MKNIPFNGILAVGDTQRQATDNYRRLALGQDVAAFRDEGGSLSFISNSSSAPNVMFNPKTGDVDVVRDDSIISQVSFASESSDEEVYPHHAVCSDGCGKHVVYDSVSSVQFCPMCTCSLAPASESGEDCTDDDGNQMNDESELESESESAAEDEAMELLDGIEDEDDEDAAEDEGEDLESESADDEDDGCEDPEEEPEDDDEDDLSDLDDEDDELDGEEDDGETSESSDGDGVVCASASKASAIKMFLKESNTSLSADQTVGVEYVVCSSDSCGAHIVHNTASLTACPVCLSSVEEPEGELDGELDLDAEDEGHDFDMEDDDLESESADGGDDDEDDLSDLDLDDGEEDEDSEDDEDAADTADTDGDSPSESSDSMTTKTAVSFSRAGAQARYVQINGLGSSLSADATVEAEYVVCSSDSCGAHIVSKSRAEFCPVCASETVDPDASEDESSVTEEEVKTTGADKAAEIMGNLGAEEKPEEPETKPGADEPAAAEGDAPDAGAEEKSEEDETDASESTDIDALALVDDSQPDAAAKLDVSYSSNVAGASAWTAFYEGKPVAMARVADAGKNADLFDKPAFGQAALSAARQIGVKTVLRDLGFKPLVHSVPVTTSLSKMVEERVAAERESLSATAKQHSERFQAALATAAIGINRGFFKGVANPLKSALCSAMADAGMRNPEALVDSVFSRNFEQFSKIAHAKAEEILQRPPEVQESLASAVLDVCYKSESSSQDGAGLESKLSSIGVSVSSGAGAIQNNNKQQPVVTAGPQVSTSSSFDEDLSLALGTLGATRR